MEYTIEDIIDLITSLIGDVPVSHQLSDALSRMALKDHTHEDSVSRIEFESLRAQVETLSALVGDTPVSEQISASLK